MEVDSINIEKKKRKSYNVKEKLNILKECTNISIRDVARKYNLSERNIRRWKNNQSQMKEFITNEGKFKAMRLKKAKFEFLEKAMCTWLQEARLRGIPLSNSIIKGKAMELSTEMGLKEKFKGSDGWLNKWKTRNDVRQLRICGETMCADVKAAKKFEMELSQKIEDENLCLSQIFNAYETGLNYKMLPKKTLAGKEKHEAPGFKGNKDRITVMMCANANGSFKLPLLIIGKYKSPRALKNLSRNTLSVSYTHQSNAQMNSEIFELWFKNTFVPQVTSFLQNNQLPIKALLLLNNAPSHPSVNILSVADIKTYFLPSNTTAIIPPMDQGIVENVKKSYKYKFLTSILINQLKDIDVITHLKHITIRDVIYWISNAWEEITKNTIAKCWKNILPNTSFLYEKQNLSLETHIQNTDLLDLLHQIENFEDIEEANVQTWVVNDDAFLDFPSNRKIIKMTKDSNID